MPFLNRIAWITALCLLGGIVEPTSAQARPRNLRFRHVSIGDGLSQSAIHSILQDRQGFLWFGTEDGLNRYDGYDFTVYKRDFDNEHSISASGVQSVREDRNGTIWIGTTVGGLNRWDRTTDRFTSFRNDPADPESLSNDNVRVILEDRSGALWLGTASGLNRLDPIDLSFDRFNHNPSNPRSLSDDSVWSLFEDGNGVLWVGTAGGLNRLDPDKKGFTHFRRDLDRPDALPHDDVRALYEDDEAQLWVGTFGGGLAVMDRESETFAVFGHDETDPESLAHDRVRAIFQDSSGTLWIGTEGGLCEWVPGAESFLRYGHDPSVAGSLSNNHVISISEDRGGVLWVGTLVGGLNKTNIATGSFAHMKREPSGLSHDAVFSFADRDDALWVGTFGGGLNRHDRVSGTFEHYKHDPDDPSSLSNDRVMSLLVDSQDVLWVGTFSAGLNRLDADGESFARFRHDPDDPASLSHDGVKFIREDREGALWIGTHRGGLNRFDRDTETFVHYRHDPDNPTSLSHDSLNAFGEAEDGIVWLGTNDGLNRFDSNSGTFARYTHDPDDATSLSHAFVTTLHEDRHGTLWIGTQSGLNRWDHRDRSAHRGAFKHYTERDGLPNDFIYGVLEDDNGWLWISTNRGLSRLNPVTEVFKNYDASHGLQSEEFNFGAYHRSADGKLFFGGINGYNSFYPDDVRENRHVPPIVLTQFLKLNHPAELTRPVSELERLELDHRDYVITFAFAALDFTAPENNTYAYKLEGFDEEWNHVDTIRRATYTNLDAGDYVFRVKGANNDGIWNEEGQSVRMHVIPPPWLSLWAYAGYATLFAAVVLAYTRAQRHKLAREADYARKLELEVAERTAELARGNDKLAQVNQKLEDASLTDSLTGLRNRRYVVDHIGRDVSLVLRSYFNRPEGSDFAPTQGDLSLLMVDLDGYKEINDTYGHATGDDVLVGVRELLELACRTSDTIVRWGGDEFLVLGRLADHRTAQHLAERIRSLISDAEFNCNGNVEKLTASVGFSCFPFLRTDPTLLSWEQVLAVADRALYLVKRSGRNAWAGIVSNENTSVSGLRDQVPQCPERLFLDGQLDLLTSLDHSRIGWDQNDAKVPHEKLVRSREK